MLAFAPVQIDVVPAPVSAKVVRGDALALTTIVCAEPTFRPQVEALREALIRLGAKGITVASEGPGALVFTRRAALASEAYAITPQRTALRVTASDPLGAARAAATLVQLAQISLGEDGAVSLPRLRLDDQPDKGYRSFMVDMGRNPQPPATLRAVVDMLWFYKGRSLQLHLSDDQLFSWPSTAFPKLQSANAGWTLADFVELESYAAARGIALIPELDVPGHSTILRRVYPEVFGTTPSELATSATARAGLTLLIDELAGVFNSSPYIHIGGDEAGGVPEDDQRDLINALDRVVRAAGKRTLVWEGPRLGRGAHKVDTRVIQLCWRSLNFPAQDMLDAGYEVVNAAWDPLYIVDHYPRTMFTAVPVERAYTLDLRTFRHVDPALPTFAKPHVTKTSKGLLGFCMPYWEGRAENLMVLSLPRFAAAASATWNRAGETNYDTYWERYRASLPRFLTLAGIELPAVPFADAASQAGNLAFRARVTPSTGASQPYFGPERLTNGLTGSFDHFLGYPATPEPLVIDIELGQPAEVERIEVFETAIGKSFELYDLEVSADGQHFEVIGSTHAGSRGEGDHVEFRFEPRRIQTIRIRTKGCHGLTFPSFSRLTEVRAY